MALKAARPALHIQRHYGNHTDKQFGVCMLCWLWPLTMIHIFSCWSARRLCSHLELLFCFIQLPDCFMMTWKMHVFLNVLFACLLSVVLFCFGVPCIDVALPKWEGSWKPTVSLLLSLLRDTDRGMRKASLQSPACRCFYFFSPRGCREPFDICDCLSTTALYPSGKRPRASVSSHPLYH